MSSPASERAEPIAPHVHVTHILRPSYGARTAQRAVPTTALTFSYYQKDGQMNRVFRLRYKVRLVRLVASIASSGFSRSAAPRLFRRPEYSLPNRDAAKRPV